MTIIHFFLYFTTLLNSIFIITLKTTTFSQCLKITKRGRFSNSVICLTNFQKGKTNTERARFTKRGKLTSPKGHIVNFFSLIIFKHEILEREHWH